MFHEWEPVLIARSIMDSVCFSIPRAERRDAVSIDRDCPLDSDVFGAVLVGAC